MFVLPGKKKKKAFIRGINKVFKRYSNSVKILNRKKKYLPGLRTSNLNWSEL